MSSDYKYYVIDYFHPIYHVLCWSDIYYCIRIHNETNKVEHLKFDLSINDLNISYTSLKKHGIFNCDPVEIEDPFDGYLYNNEDKFI